MFKNYIQKKLEGYVRKYFLKHPEVKLIVVTGSVGKTTTKTNIATVLSQTMRVRMEDTNHNTHMSAPLGILGVEYPEKVHSIFAWLAVFRAMRTRIKQPTDVDVIVQELGTDRIGEIAHFGTYLRPDIAVVTGVTPEHMEFFGTIENVAQEELEVINYSKLGLINRDDVDGRFASFITNASIGTYGTSGSAEYRFEIEDFTIEQGYTGRIFAPEFPNSFSAQVKILGEHTLRPLLGAIAVASKLGLTPESITGGLAAIRPVKGRMNVLKGQNDSILIDDSYNSSPAAAHAALQTLYSINAPQRIAVLGSMNELGDSTAIEHQALGRMCDSSLLAWVVTIGEDAEKYLAPEARLRGCQVKSFRSAIDAGAFVHSILELGSVVLIKGSQGNVYAEEAIKILLHDTHDDHQLVRQSPAWMKTKNDFFQSF
jgi:UDP-N-acetylmuramoyl-tripeptide--D-alanyl-D-alanine ligase